MSEPEKKGIGSRLWSLVTEDVPDKNDAQAPQAPTAPVGVPMSPAVASMPFQVSAPVAVIDPVVRKKLEDSISAEAPAGYAEIVNNLVTLSEDIPDERSRYRAAIRLAGKAGHTLDHLLGDLDKCVGILEAKAREFADEVKRQIDTKVGARRTSIAQRESEITSKTQLIVQLQGEIAQLQQANLTESEDIASETAKITGIGNNFNLAYQAVHAAVIEQRNKISTYGKV